MVAPMRMHSTIRSARIAGTIGDWKVSATIRYIAATVRMVMSVPIMLPSWVQLTVAWINVRINPT